MYSMHSKNKKIGFKVLFLAFCVYMGKGKGEVVVGIVAFLLFSESKNFIIRQEQKTLSDHTKISIARKYNNNNINTSVYFYFKACNKITKPN